MVSTIVYDPDVDFDRVVFPWVPKAGNAVFVYDIADVLWNFRKGNLIELSLIPLLNRTTYSCVSLSNGMNSTSSSSTTISFPFQN
jgi:hypothetical protein